MNMNISTKSFPKISLELVIAVEDRGLMTHVQLKTLKWGFMTHLQDDSYVRFILFVNKDFERMGIREFERT